ncbi:MAG TPA: TMEM175 family protein [Mucilaginibacter sp.]|jgi:uncharacterized membrane protein
MQVDQEEKNLERERLVFFCDAVIAIAITLLALDLKVKPAGPHLTFADIANAWHTFAAFILSFIIIAVFWINHHRFFVYIKAVDSKVITYNIGWLLFIVLLPFTTSLISSDFFNKPAMFLYSGNVLMVTYFQNAIWDHVSIHRELAKDTLTKNINREYRVGCNIAIGNALFAIVATFFSPLLAFITLVTRTFLFRRSAQRWVARVTQKRIKKKEMVERR